MVLLGEKKGSLKRGWEHFWMRVAKEGWPPRIGGQFISSHALFGTIRDGCRFWVFAVDDSPGGDLCAYVHRGGVRV
jgi:hypothetical protein